LQVQETHLSKQVRCPACQQVFVAAAPPPPEEVPDVGVFEVPQPSPVRAARPSPRGQAENPLNFEERPGHDLEEDDQEAGEVRPHRGGLILTLGILSLVFAFCCPLLCWIEGGIALNMANSDLRMMSLRKMDRSGRGMTQTGKTLLNVGVAISIVNVVIGIILRVSGLIRL
jgi:hypothetical protein